MTAPAALRDALVGLWRRRGLRALPTAVHRLSWFLARRVLGPRSFTLAGRTHAYFLHPFVMDTERTVELRLGIDHIDGSPSDAVLEVGNVLATYTPVEHTVLDRYERAPHVCNEDAATFDWSRRFDRIVCLSTLEHVGRDEASQDLAKAERALANLRRHLKPEGELLATIPLGYHPRLDQRLADDRLGARSCRFLQRISRWGTWSELTDDDGQIGAARYGAPYPCGNVLAVLHFEPLIPEEPEP